MRTRTLKSVLAGGVCALALTTAAHAENREFAVPAGELSQALDLYIRQSGEQLIYRVADVRGMKSPGVSGALSTEEALARLLEGTSLTIKRDASGLIAVASMDTPAPQSGSAAGGGAEVEALIVTAQKREEDIQDVPIAISAFSQEDLTRSQVAGGPDLMTQVPNMTFTKTNFSSYSIQIRGIGTQAISATTDPAVAVAFNNTPFVRNHFFEQEFYDLQRVEVLRGPQGTLYGRNATAGVVNVISAKPSLSGFEAKLSGDIANYKSTRIEGMLNLPLVEDKAALRIAGAWTKREGFVTNTLTGQQTDGRDLWSGRVSLRIEPTDWLRADLVYEHFEEDDDRLRSGKQLCRKEPAITEINGTQITQAPAGLLSNTAGYFTQGCLPASLYSPDSFQTPNGYALPYYGSIGGIGGPVYQHIDPYASNFQSRDLRQIETHLKPEYEASADIVELQLNFDISDTLSFTSETAFARDYIFSFQDFNRFNTVPGLFVPNGEDGVDENGVFCDPQLGCSNRVVAGDLATATSQQFSQEFRIGSSFDGPLNFSLGANFLRYDTEDKYYVFINSLTALKAIWIATWDPTQVWTPQEDMSFCFDEPNGQNWDNYGYVWSNPNALRSAYACAYIDPHNIHNLNDQGRNYFLSKNPYHLLSYAAFGELYYNITPDLKVTVGARWTVDQKTAPQIPSFLLAGVTYGSATRKVIEQEWREPTGRLAVDWKPDLGFTDETLVYGSYVRGYKAGGANPPPAIVVAAPVNLPFEEIALESLTHPETFGPEFVNAYEIGTKNTLLDGRLTFNLNAFYYDYTGYQISQIVDRSAVNLNFDAKIWGSELEIDWRPLENLRLGFKGGYESTRMADGSRAIDLMDRTAGDPAYILKRPFPTVPSNCIVPLEQALLIECEGYLNGGNAHVPNGGEGIFKDLSGNELPNAPDFTATITADYSLPLPHDWLMTLHTDLYYQSEAWTRIFNTEGYDKLKAYTNVNLAAIFTNENAGWNVMAYVKNVMDRDSITGAFLNSDDTGLTTNVFLTEPRLFGLRVTKAWTGGSGWGGFGAGPEVYQPWRLEFGGLYGEFSNDHERVEPAGLALSDPEQPYPLHVQDDIDWGAAGGVKLTYQPVQGGWFGRAGIRYGRASGSAEAHPKWALQGLDRFGPKTIDFIADLTGLPIEFIEEQTAGKYFDPSAQGIYEYATTTASSEESFAVADFQVGADFGLGRANSSLSLGLRYARFKSSNEAVLHGRPAVEMPEEELAKYGIMINRFHADVLMGREFSGVGPSVDWEASIPLIGDRKSSGSIDIDVGVGAAALWGRQKVDIEGEIRGDESLRYRHPFAGGDFTNGYTQPVSIKRSSTTTVPSINANLGLSYTVGGFKVSGGYRLERYFDVLDGGIEERRDVDRQYDGPYFKVSVGFGG